MNVNSGAGRARILLITPIVPAALGNGSQQRTEALCRALEDFGTVEVLVISTRPTAPSIAVLASRPFREVVSPQSGRILYRFNLSRALSDQVHLSVDLNAYDIICARYLSPACMLDLPKHIPKIVDLDDFGYSYHGKAARLGLKSAKAMLRSWLRGVLERRALGRFDRFWFVTDRDQTKLAKLPGGVLRNIPRALKGRPDFESEGRTLLFVGALWYGPNRDGMQRFLSNAWPKIRAAVPDATLELIGEVSELDRQKWGALSGVRLLGFVEDLDRHYKDSALAIAPIFTGGGSSIKILEALAQGRICVTTRFAIDAFRPALSDSVVAVGSDEKEMADRCIELLRDKGARSHLARLGYEAVTTNFSFDAFRRSVRLQAEYAMNSSVKIPVQAKS